MYFKLMLQGIHEYKNDFFIQLNNAEVILQLAAGGLQSNHPDSVLAILNFLVTFLPTFDIHSSPAISSTIFEVSLRVSSIFITIIPDFVINANLLHPKERHLFVRSQQYLS